MGRTPEIKYIDIARRVQIDISTASQLISQGYEEVLELMPHHHPTLLRIAMARGHLRVLRKMNYLRPVDWVFLFSSDDYHIPTHLIQYLIQNGHDVNDGNIILLAILSNELASVKYLHRHGSYLQSATWMSLAVRNDNMEIVRFLESQGCSFSRTLDEAVRCLNIS